MKTINFAIDLGTTNSLISSNINGDLTVYKNPFGHNEVLPSIVGFRGSRVIIGDKAKVYLEKDPENVFGGFKRKMGTEESYWIASETRSISPVELSSLILKELKNFLYEKESIQEVVITIPASFDTIQSNATKEAGIAAGFSNVVLLQEPIAACLAFANQNQEESKVGKWLVYDLGGGTFDVALVSATEEELKVIDHKGDNYLGGLDFDRALVQNVMWNQIIAKEDFKHLIDLKAKNDIAFQKIDAVLMQKAEVAKIDLSFYPETFVDLTLTDSEGNSKLVSLEITREEFNIAVLPKIQYSVQLVKDLLKENDLKASDLEKIILVGGSSKMPLVKDVLSKEINIPLDFSVDPTNAIVVGASYYASSKVKATKEECKIGESSTESNLNINTSELLFTHKLSYLTNTRESEEMIIGMFSGDFIGSKYRLVRNDNGFDTGIKNITAKVIETLTLRASSVNNFDLYFYDHTDTLLQKIKDAVSISAGLYQVDGQPLPNDICLEVDDLESKQTIMEAIFSKNNILPLRKTIYKEISKSIFKDSDSNLIINILEGDKLSSPFSNQVIGCIEVKGTDLDADLIKGSDVEITLEISESRDLTVEVYLSMLDKEIKQVFSPSVRSVSVSKLKEELSILQRRVNQEFLTVADSEEYEAQGFLHGLLNEITVISEELNTDISSDIKYHIDARKMQISQKLDKLNVHSRKNTAVENYQYCKTELEDLLSKDNAAKVEFGDRYNKAIKDEDEFLSKAQPHYIVSKTNELNEIIFRINLKSFDFMVNLYYHTRMTPEEYITDLKRFTKLAEEGERLVDKGSKPALESIVAQMQQLAPNYFKDQGQDLKGTGLQ